VRCARLIALAALATGALTLAPAAQAAGAPEVLDSWASAVNATGVQLHGEVDPGGLPTAVKVEYIPTSAYQANLAATPPRDPFAGAVASPPAGEPIGSGPDPVEFARHIGGLKPTSAYRYRIAATNSEGTASGPPHPFLTPATASGSFALPDSRGWEMVSPVDKNGGEIPPPGGTFGGGVGQAGAEGGSVTYSSPFSFAGGEGAPGANQYISRRTEGVWATENVTTPTLAGAYGPHPDGVPYQLFSGDLARGLLFDPQRCATEPCPRAYALRQSSGGALASSPQASDLAFAGASPDLAHVVLSSCAALSADATEAPGVGGACDPAAANLYSFSGAGLTLINLLPGESQGTPGAALAAQSGAVSADGARTYFTLAGNLYLREGNQTVQVDAGVGGGASFQTATPDGALAFFSKAEHLYRYTVPSAALTDLTPGGGVEGVLGASPDGAFLYYLTGAGLFLAHGGATTKVADTAEASDYPPASGTARVAANGNLAFLATEPLTEADGGGFSQVYLYSVATASLSCASCNPSGERPSGPATIPGAVANGTLPTATRAYKPRVLSGAGDRLFFQSADALVATDSNNDQDVYEWEAQGVGSCEQAGGCVDLISSGRSSEGASFLDASADGSDAFFVTDGSLVATDPGASDVYDARVGGGFPVPTPPLACVADACQVLPGEPDDPATGTAFFRPEGNPPLSYPKAAKKQHKKQSKKHKKQHQKHHKKQHHKKHRKQHKKHHKRAAKQGGRS
jgi:hypothetical protein